MSETIKSLTFPPVYKHLLLGALMRSESKIEDLKESAKEAHKLSVKMLEFINIGTTHLKPSVMLFMTESVLMNMTYNLWPDISNEVLKETKITPASLEGFLSTIQCIVETMIVDLNTNATDYSVDDTKDGDLTEQEIFDGIIKRVLEIKELTTRIKG